MSQTDPIESLFTAAVALPTDKRSDFLDAKCANEPQLREQVEALLHAHDRANSLLDQTSPSSITALHVSNVHHSGDLLAGRYKLLEQIGAGGMGAVWLAEQKEPVKRKVAIKLIKAGMDSRQVLARFEAERQALAMMDHHHIAKVLDGGMTEQGRPYFVMELVKGITLTDYCDQVQLSVRERLELFHQVCMAVQHAHQKGIIHRDLKPSNILVTEYDGKPICKVIDFGLAKAVHGSHSLTDLSMNTAFGAVVGTPLYMSPEQLATNALDIDTRSDLYSLGVILYELLTGSTPIEKHRLKNAAMAEILRIVREEEPAIPSQRLSSSDTLPNLAARRHVEPARLTKLIRGDLDWIVMKSLEKDRNRRYDTANGLALDVQRYLLGEAVLAAPPSRIYRLRKFVRKHKGPVIAASLLGFSLIAGIIGTSYGLYQANLSAIAERNSKVDAQNKQAEAEKQKAEADKQRAEADLQRSMAESQRIRAEEREKDAIDAVKRFEDSVANNPELKNNPSLEPLRQTLLREPLAFFMKLRDRLESDNDTRPESLARLAQAAYSLGHLTNEIGNKENALAAYQQTIQILERLVADNPSVTKLQSDLASSLNNVGVLLGETGNVMEQMATAKKALQIRERLAKENPNVPELQSDLSMSHNNMAELLRKIGNLAEAMQSIEKALQIRERLAKENPNEILFQRDLAKSYFTFAKVKSDTGNAADALKGYERALQIQERLAVQYPSQTWLQKEMGDYQNAFGESLKLTGKSNEALNAYDSAMKTQERLVTENPTVSQFQSDLASTNFNIGLLLRKTGKPEEALQAFEKGLKIQEQLASKHSNVIEFLTTQANSYNMIGLLLQETGRPTESLQSYEKALQIRGRLAIENPTVPDIQSFFGGALHNRALLELDQNDFASARDRILQAIDHQKRAVLSNPRHPVYREYLRNHYFILIHIAEGLNDPELSAKAERGLAELDASDPQVQALDARLAVIANGEPAKDNTELLALAARAYDTRQLALAAKCFTKALENEPKLAEDRQSQIRYNAACCASLAASDAGQKPESSLDDSEKSQLRKQAFDLLTAELETWSSLLDSGAPESKVAVAQTLAHWQKDSDLTEIRASDRLANMPKSERTAWESLWQRVEELRARAASEDQSEQ